jgi:hypothetical protein
VSARRVLWEAVPGSSQPRGYADCYGCQENSAGAVATEEGPDAAGRAGGRRYYMFLCRVCAVRLAVSILEIEVG